MSIMYYDAKYFIHCKPLIFACYIIIVSIASKSVNLYDHVNINSEQRVKQLYS